MNNAENLTNVKIELLQGENSPLTFITTLTDDATLKVVSGTLAYRIILLMKKARKYKMKLGFSFARKFDVRISINNVDKSGTEVQMQSAQQFGITLQDKESSFINFHDFIDELVDAILTGSDQMQDTFDELIKEIQLN